jgi:hypothetical protein
MLEGIDAVKTSSGIDALKYYQAQQFGAVSGAAKKEVQEQFLALFYKEIFKNVCKLPNISGDSSDGMRSFSSIYADNMAEWMARKLAKDKKFAFNAQVYNEQKEPVNGGD